MGIDLTTIAEVINGMPESELNTIKWTNPIDWNIFRKDIEQMCQDILSGGQNMLFKK